MSRKMFWSFDRVIKVISVILQIIALIISIIGLFK